MASLSFEKRGSKRHARVWFEVEKQRKSIRLGEISKRNAENMLAHFRELETCKRIADTVQPRTRQWLQDISNELHQKISNTGLVAAREHRLIKEFFDAWAKDKQIATNTRLNRSNAAKKVVEAFGAETPLHAVTPAQAEQFFSDMSERFAQAHANKLVKCTRQVFNKAVRLKLIQDNPFTHLKIGDESNSERQAFVDQATIEKVIEAATDNEFRLLIALARYAGLRIPSEIVGLKWGHVNWETGRIEISDVKRKRTRIIPIFAELKPYLEAVWNEAADGTVFVIPRYQSPDQNLRSRLLRTIKRAGITPWPKPWQNLRSSRETELADRYPIQVVTSWIGNSVSVAHRHYLQVTDNHFESAMGADRVQSASMGANVVQHSRAATRETPDKQKLDANPRAAKSVPVRKQKQLIEQLELVENASADRGNNQNHG